MSLAAGAIVSIIAFTLSMAFRRKFRGEGASFYLIMLALMTPGFLLALGTQLFWSWLGEAPSLWKTALGANVIWGIPFGFLVMLAVWNRYDERIEEAARDLGADQKRTFREVTLPLVWTGIFGCFLFGFTLAWNDYDRSILLVSGSEIQTLPLTIGGLTFTGAIRPDLYALGTATTLVSLGAIVLLLVVAAVRLRFVGRRAGSRDRGGARRRGGAGHGRGARLLGLEVGRMPAPVVVVSTGGTIAMRPEPGTGKLVPATTAEELLEMLAWPDAPPLDARRLPQRAELRRPRRARSLARCAACSSTARRRL